MDGCLRAVVWKSEALGLVEYCAFRDGGQGLRLEGVVIAVVDGKPARIRYQVACDAQGLTRWAEVEAAGGRLFQEGGERRIHLAADEHRRWTWNGRELPECQGFADVDLGFTPATNTLPVRRLGLAVGQSQTISAAWVRFPEFDVVAFPQRYTRTGANQYRYESLLSDFQAELSVDEMGIVRTYGNYWVAAAMGEDC